MKQCRTCGEEKPLSAFYEDKTCRDGKRPSCRACVLARAKVTGKLRRQNMQQVDVAEKRCHVCGDTKPVEAFGLNRTKKDGHNSACRSCHTKRAKVHQDKTRYGITPADREYLALAQGNRCGICNEVGSLVVDHCHETGRLRGMLCGKCNKALGALGDSVEGLMKAVEYLQSDALLLRTTRVPRRGERRKTTFTTPAA